MAWECAYLDASGLFCQKLNKDCDPAQKGCVLYGKVRRVDPTPSDARLRRPEGPAKNPS